MYKAPHSDSALLRPSALMLMMSAAPAPGHSPVVFEGRSSFKMSLRCCVAPSISIPELEAIRSARG